jgi:hypothetical protein
MNFYQSNFAAFVLLNAVLAYREYRQGGEIQLAEKEEINPRKLVESNDKEALKKFKWRFLPIYLLVNGADWLQVCGLAKREAYGLIIDV